MQEKDFQFIENAAAEEGVGVIKLFEAVNEDSAKRFVEEFRWLESARPKRIDIKINSAGGSVLHGWSIVDAILSSQVPTRGIVVGVAASMASVILAAADEAHMMSYASIMVHNPFFSSGEPGEGNPQLATFREQLIDLYMKRWGKPRREVEALMDGTDGHDGTWFSAREAKKLGLVSKVVKVPAQDAKRFEKVSPQALAAEMAAEDIQARFQEVLNELQSEKASDMKEVKAKLGLEEASGEAEVLAKVGEILEREGKLQETVNTLTEEIKTLKVEAAGAKATIENANATIAEQKEQIDSLSAKVGEYEAKEREAELKRRESIVDAAIEEGKINAEDKDNWMSLLNEAPETAEKVLNQLQAVGKKKKLSEQIKNELNGEQEAGQFKLPTIHDAMQEIDSKRK